MSIWRHISDHATKRIISNEKQQQKELEEEEEEK